MDNKNALSQQLTRLFQIWSQSEAKIRLYGPTMPQSKQFIEELFGAFHEVLKDIPSFSIVKNNHSFDMIAHTNVVDADDTQPIETSDATLQAAQSFDRFELQSLTFQRDLSLTELEQFFQGLHMSPQEAKLKDGLNGFFTTQQITHIELNRLCLEPQQKVRRRRSNDITQAAEQALEDLLRQTTPGLKSREAPLRQKSFASTWERYLGDQLEVSEFKTLHKNIIALAQDKTDMFVRTLQHMAAKQDKIETFLAHLEEKLLALGFPSETVKQISHKLGAAKKVLIDEAELARLRQIEKDYQPDLANRIEQSLAKIDCLQHKLTDERERNDAMIRQTSQGVMVLDRDGRILDANPIAQKVLGLSTQALRGKCLTEVIQKHHMLSVVSHWEEETDTHTPKQVRIEAGDERTIDTIRESAIVIEDKNGRSIGEVAALQDVIHQQELEKRKNDILDVIGHDLRAPLNIIKQNIDLLAEFTQRPEGLPLAQQQEFLEASQRHIDRMSKLINKILDLRKLETGKMILKKETIITHRLINDATHSLDSWAQDKAIALQCNVNTLPGLYCDAERIYQVITNLVSNAVKFTPKGGLVLVTARTHEKDGQAYIEISVVDSGIGIKSEDLQRIFNKYEQISLQQPAGVSGLGLGLSTCKAIVEMHNGTIWATSHGNDGTTFTFEIPLLPDPDTSAT